MSWNKINVTTENIREGTSGCSQNCAIAWAIVDSLNLPDYEQISVDGCDDIYKTYKVGDSYYDIGYKVHPEDKERVRNFIDWFDDQMDYEDLSKEDDETLECHTLTFRLRERTTNA